MSCDLFGFENSYLYEAFLPAQDHLFWETTQEIQDSSNFLIQVNNNEINASVVLENSSTFSCFGRSDDSGAMFLQRSYGHNYYQNQQTSSFNPLFDYVSESKKGPESSFSSGEMRSICSNADSHREKTSMRRSSMEEPNFKVGRYSAQERRERIDRYRAKRSRRNFNKTIKYACRKTLADGRQRVRGRFVRNDEVAEILRASLFRRCEDENYFWIDCFMKKMRKDVQVR